MVKRQKLVLYITFFLVGFIGIITLGGVWAFALHAPEEKPVSAKYLGVNDDLIQFDEPLEGLNQH